jgi:rhamnosyltransferase
MNHYNSPEINRKISPEPNMQNICAIVITYHPDTEIYDRIERIASQVNKVIIVDNGSSEKNILVLNKISSELGVHLILNEDNLGVATALNIGFDFACNSDYLFDWCLTMDQDTILYPQMVQNLINAYKDCPFKKDLGIIGSNYEEYNTGRILYDNKNNKNSWAEVEHLPTSGCLTSVAIYKSVGKFRDNLFIDYIDTEYCMRLKENGFRVIISPEVNMRHPLGDYKFDKLFKFLFGRDMITNYSPIRHYYWTRNGISIAVEQFGKNTKWSIKELYYLLIRRVMIVLFFEDFKVKKMRNIFLGIFHAFIGRHSKLNDNH